MNRSVVVAVSCAMVMMMGYLLIIARGVLVPIVLAIFIWNILNSIERLIVRLPWIGAVLPKWLSMCLSWISVVGFIMVVANILENNLNEVMDASARYHANLKHLMGRFDQQSLAKMVKGVESFVKDLDVQGVFMHFYTLITSLASSAILIALYVAFLFIEQDVFPQKIANLFPKAETRARVILVLNRITHDIQTYLGLKTLLSLMTAFLSWLMMSYVGLDFSEFWALLIFFLNYIPNIGAIIATAFPVLLGFIQFAEPWSAMVMMSGLVTIQFVMGNIIEPRFMGHSLNLSALVILIALAVWGAIWGVLGMFLSVPITVMMMIIFSQFPSTRPLAILLSQSGSIHVNEKPSI